MDNSHDATPGPQPSFERYPPLSNLTRTHVDTAQAAFYLNRKAQTLRIWACYGNGPIRPMRVHGRLCWSVAGIKELMPG